jgi:WD40 repeat protein
MRGGSLIQTFEGHTDGVQSLALSPDGTLLLSGSSDRTVKLWNVEDGSTITTIQGSLIGHVLRVAMSPDGSLFAMADDLCFVQIRRTISGVLLRSLAQPDCFARFEGTVSAWGLTFSPDGEYLLAGESRPCCGGSLQKWEVDTYQPPTSVLDYELKFRDVVYAPGGSKLALAFTGSPVFWLIRSVGGDPLQTFEGHAYQVNSLAFSPDGELLVSGSRDQKVRVWRVMDGELLTMLEGHDAEVTSVAFSPDGRTFASGSLDGTVIVWGLGP